MQSFDFIKERAPYRSAGLRLRSPKNLAGLGVRVVAHAKTTLGLEAEVLSNGG